MPDRLLETKFHIPTWRAGGVIRPRLQEQLQAGLNEHRKLTFISAPAGYGKTPLVTGWLDSIEDKSRIVWLSIENGDDDPTRFLNYWVTALQRMGDFELDSIQNLLYTPQILSPQDILDEAINELTLLEEQAILVFDDYHAITNPVIHEILEYFLEHQPSHVHLVLIMRSDPSLPLARLRARGQLVEIRARDLRFTENEAW